MRCPLQARVQQATAVAAVPRSHNKRRVVHLLRSVVVAVVLTNNSSRAEPLAGPPGEDLRDKGEALLVAARREEGRTRGSR